MAGKVDEKRMLAAELHKPARVQYKRRSFIMKGIDDTWQIDLVEMHKHARENKGFNYILTGIDVFSKFGFAVPVKNKTGRDVTAAFEKVLLDTKRTPKNVHSDLGKEFYNSTFQDLMKKHSINHYSTFSSQKAFFCERLNRTLKEMMYREFTVQGSYKWLDLLPRIVILYNNRKHRTIGMKPADVKKRDEKYLLKNVYETNRRKRKSPKFKVGDVVRVSKQKTAFTKGYEQSWSNELFTVRKVQYTIPPTYLLNDYQKQPIFGGFYEQELQKSKLRNVYFIEKILKRSRKKIFVKWLGFDKTHNSWIKDAAVIK
ncbi:MAG: hypothetical protein RLZZ574_370 [Cyanobacteriota bacterium]